MATAISQNVNGREKALTTLTGLMAKLPAQAQGGIAKAIAAISGDSQDEVLDIVSALQSGQVSDAAQPALTQALTAASGAMFTGVERLQGLVATLPGPAQGPVQNAINRASRASCRASSAAPSPERRLDPGRSPGACRSPATCRSPAG